MRLGRKKKKPPPGPEPTTPSLPGRNPPPGYAPIDIENDPLYNLTFLENEFEAPEPESPRPGQNPPPTISA